MPNPFDEIDRQFGVTKKKSAVGPNKDPFVVPPTADANIALDMSKVSLAPLSLAGDPTGASKDPFDVIDAEFKVPTEKPVEKPVSPTDIDPFDAVDASVETDPEKIKAIQAERPWLPLADAQHRAVWEANRKKSLGEKAGDLWDGFTEGIATTATGMAKGGVKFLREGSLVGQFGNVVSGDKTPGQALKDMGSAWRSYGSGAIQGVQDLAEMPVDLFTTGSAVGDAAAELFGVNDAEDSYDAYLSRMRAREFREQERVAVPDAGVRTAAWYARAAGDELLADIMEQEGFVPDKDIALLGEMFSPIAPEGALFMGAGKLARATGLSDLAANTAEAAGRGVGKVVEKTAGGVAGSAEKVNDLVNITLDATRKNPIIAAAAGGAAVLNPLTAAQTAAAIGAVKATPPIARVVEDVGRSMSTKRGRMGVFEAAAKDPAARKATQKIFGGLRGRSLDAATRGGSIIFGRGAQGAVLAPLLGFGEIEDFEQLGQTIGTGVVAAGFDTLPDMKGEWTMHQRRAEDADIENAFSRMDPITAYNAKDITSFDSKLKSYQDDQARVAAELAELEARAQQEGESGDSRFAPSDGFVPSKEWQEVPEGTAVPPGGEYRMDMAAGKTFARWDSPPAASTGSQKRKTSVSKEEIEAKRKQLDHANKNLANAEKTTPEQRAEYERQTKLAVADITALADGLGGNVPPNLAIHILPEAEIVALIKQNNPNISDEAAQTTAKNIGFATDPTQVRFTIDPSRPSIVLNADRIKQNLSRPGESVQRVLMHEAFHALEQFPGVKESMEELNQKLFGVTINDMTTGETTSVIPGLYTEKDLVDMFNNEYYRNRGDARIAQIHPEFYDNGVQNAAKVAEYMRREVRAEYAAGLSENNGSLINNIRNPLKAARDWARLAESNTALGKARDMLKAMGVDVSRDPATGKSKLLGMELDPTAVAAVRNLFRQVERLNGDLGVASGYNRDPAPIPVLEIMKDPRLQERYKNVLFDTSTTVIITNPDGTVTRKVLRGDDALINEGVWVSKDGKLVQAEGTGKTPTGITAPEGATVTVAIDIARNPDGTPIRLSNRELERRAKKRNQLILQAIDSAPDTGAPNRMKNVGNGVYRGVLTSPQLDAIDALPDAIVVPTLKTKIRQLNEILQRRDGTRVMIEYQAVYKDGKARSLAPKFRDEVPIGFQISKAGNFLVITMSVSRMFDKLNAWRARMPERLAPWGGNVERFWSDFTAYLANHQQGLDGETGLDPNAGIAANKKNILNDFLNIYTKETEGLNPDRTKVGSGRSKRRADADINRVIASIRIDRITDMVESNADKMPIDYRKVTENRMPDNEGPQFMPGSSPRELNAKGWMSLEERRLRANHFAHSFARLTDDISQDLYGMSYAELDRTGNLEALEEVRQQATREIHQSPPPSAKVQPMPGRDDSGPQFMPASEEIRKKGTKQHLEFWNRELENSGIAQKPRTVDELDEFIRAHVVSQREKEYSGVFPEPDINKLRAYYQKTVRDVSSEDAIDFPANWMHLRGMSQRAFDKLFSKAYAQQITKQRVQSLVTTADYLLGNAGYTPAEVAQIIASARKQRVNSRKDQDGNIVPFIQKITSGNEAVPNEISGATAARIVEKMQNGMPSDEAFVQGVFEGITATARKIGNYDGWVKFHQSNDREDAEKLNEAVATTSWCTGGSVDTANRQLSAGDFYVYFSEGDPKIAIRTESGAAVEVRGRGKSQTIETQDLRDKAEEFMLSNEGPTGGEDYLSDQRFRRHAIEAGKTGVVPIEAYRYYDQTGEFLPFTATPSAPGPARFEGDFLDLFAKAKIDLTKVVVDGRMLTNLNLDKEIPSASIVHVDGQIYEDGATIIDLPDLQTVGKDILSRGAQSINLPNLKTSSSITALVATKVNLPNLEKIKNIRAEVATDIDLSNLKIGGNLYVYNVKRLIAPVLKTSGDIHAENATEISLPSLKTSGDIDAKNATEISLSNLETCRHLNISKTERIDLPRLKNSGRFSAKIAIEVNLPTLETADNIFIANLKKVELPSLKVSRDIILNEATQVNLPNLEIARDLYVHAAKKLIAPALKKSGVLLAMDVEHLDLPNLEISGKIRASDATRVNLPKLQNRRVVYAPNAAKWSGPQFMPGDWVARQRAKSVEKFDDLHTLAKVQSPREIARILNGKTWYHGSQKEIKGEMSFDESQDGAHFGQTQQQAYNRIWNLYDDSTSGFDVDAGEFKDDDAGRSVSKVSLSDEYENRKGKVYQVRADLSKTLVIPRDVDDSSVLTDYVLRLSNPYELSEAPLTDAQILELSKLPYVERVDATIDQLKKNGYDSVAYRNENEASPGSEGDISVLVLKRNRMMSPTTGAVQFLPDGNPNPEFYSRLAQGFKDSPQKTFSRDQALALARKSTNAEELKWSGIEEFIEGRDKVSKEEIAQYLADEGAVRFEEVTLANNQIGTEQKVAEATRNAEAIRMRAEREYGTDSEDWPQDVSEELMTAEMYIEDAVNEPNERGNYSENAPKFSEQTLPGGENYREVVLAMADVGNRNDELADWKRQATAKYGQGWTPEQLTPYERKRLSELESKKDRPTANYTSSHFPNVPNYVAHMRLNDRVDAEGREGLLIEELQSDLHQVGRKKGYRGDEKLLSKDKSKYTAEYREETQDWGVTDGDGKFIGRFYGVDAEGAKERARQSIVPDNARVPDAPFRKDWPLQMFKRALRDAISGGKEWIGWTTGDTQAERYNLSKQVDSVLVWESVTPGYYHYEAKKDGRTITGEQDRQGVTASKLADAIGKELTDKAVRDLSEGKRAEYSGDSLKVGGEGMKGFYDNMLPKEIGKYVKKWGGKVESSEIVLQKDHYSKLEEEMQQISQEQGPNRDNWDDEAIEQFIDLQDQLVQGPGSLGDFSQPIHRVNITPQMRESVQSGQPQFMPDVDSLSKIYKETLSDPPETTGSFEKNKRGPLKYRNSWGVGKWAANLFSNMSPELSKRLEPYTKSKLYGGGMMLYRISNHAPTREVFGKQSIGETFSLDRGVSSFTANDLSSKDSIGDFKSKLWGDPKQPATVFVVMAKEGMPAEDAASALNPDNWADQDLIEDAQKYLEDEQEVLLSGQFKVLDVKELDGDRLVLLEQLPANTKTKNLATQFMPDTTSLNKWWDSRPNSNRIVNALIETGYSQDNAELIAKTPFKDLDDNDREVIQGYWDARNEGRSQQLQFSPDTLSPEDLDLVNDFVQGGSDFFDQASKRRLQVFANQDLETPTTLYRISYQQKLADGIEPGAVVDISQKHGIASFTENDIVGFPSDRDRLVDAITLEGATIGYEDEPVIYRVNSAERGFKVPYGQLEEYTRESWGNQKEHLLTGKFVVNSVTKQPGGDTLVDLTQAPKDAVATAQVHFNPDQDFDLSSNNDFLSDFDNIDSQYENNRSNAETTPRIELADLLAVTRAAREASRAASSESWRTTSGDEHWALNDYLSKQPAVNINDFGPPARIASMEHTIYFGAPDGRVRKVVDGSPGGEYGLDPVGGDPTASKYLERIALSNEFLGDDIRVEGITADGQLVISQPFIESMVDADGDPVRPTPNEIRDTMIALGFEEVPGQLFSSSYYVREVDGRIVEAHDTHDGNFIKTPEGIVKPIDLVIVERPAPRDSGGLQFAPDPEFDAELRSRLDGLVANATEDQPGDYRITLKTTPRGQGEGPEEAQNLTFTIAGAESRDDAIAKAERSRQYRQLQMKNGQSPEVESATLVEAKPQQLDLPLDGPNVG
jgi:hypothetical protein